MSKPEKKSAFFAMGAFFGFYSGNISPAIRSNKDKSNDKSKRIKNNRKLKHNIKFFP